MLKQSDIAPDFKVKDIFEKEVSLSKDGKYTYLSFHRFATCPFCVLRTRELIKAYPRFEEHQIAIVSIWPSSKSNMLQYIGSENALFPMIADENKMIFQKYRVVKSSMLSVFKMLVEPMMIYQALKGRYKKMVIDADPNLLPAEFLISPAGEIVLAYYGKHFGDHLDLETIFKHTLPKN